MDYKEVFDIYKMIIEKAGLTLLGKTMPYTSANGHMFSQLNKDGLIGIRFSKEVQDKYLAEFNTEYFRSYGKVMKGYVLIPIDLLNDHEILSDYLKESYNYVMSLKAK